MSKKSNLIAIAAAACLMLPIAALAQETPFFFEHRSSWVASYDRFAQASVGLHALDAASVELFPHQAEAIRRVLQDPQVRYLLADEVGLGKTIEAGAILRHERRTQLLRQTCWGDAIFHHRRSPLVPAGHGSNSLAY